MRYRIRELKGSLIIRNPFLHVYELYHTLEASFFGMPELPLKRSA